MHCTTCVFLGKDNLGTICRRFPPKIIAVSDNTGKMVPRAHFPKIWADNAESFCGEYRGEERVTVPQQTQQPQQTYQQPPQGNPGDGIPF